MSSIQKIFQDFGPSYLERFSETVPFQHRKVIAAIQRCRSGDDGYCVYVCEDCDETHVQPRSCGNRHCPQCQHAKTQQWLEKQLHRQLPGHHFMVTFTVPEALREVIRAHQKEGYGALFSSSADAIKTLAVDPENLGGEAGFFGVLHTWGRMLQYHPHIHYIVPGGVLDEKGEWQASSPGFLLPVHALSTIFRAKFRDAMRKAGLYDAIPSEVWDTDWNVNCQAVGSAESTLKYLAPYVFKVAISDARIVQVEAEQVTFTYKKSGSSRQRTMTLHVHEFMRRFLQHVLPAGFMKVRYYGFLNPSHKMPMEELKARIELASGFEVLAPQVDEAVHVPPACRACGGALRYRYSILPRRSEVHATTGPPLGATMT